MAEQEDNKQFVAQRIYVKDASFESPGAPKSFPGVDGKPWQPKHQLGIDISITEISENVHEVALHITVTNYNGDDLVFIAEVHQACTYLCAGLNEEELGLALNVNGATSVFPFARQTICDMVVKGGFPPFLLAQIDFYAVYQKQKAAAAAAAEPDETAAEN